MNVYAIKPNLNFEKMFRISILNYVFLGIIALNFTTSLEANWMGVPLLTKKGNNFYSRIGTSINKNLNMEDWIANDEKDYILKAISKTSDLEKLFKIKNELRNKFLKSPLSNTNQYVKHFEDCLNSMWKTYLKNKFN